jgi:hypothetical protein
VPDRRARRGALWRWGEALVAGLVGRPERLPAALLARYPELAEARWRRGGLPLRVGGWCLGQSTVSGITLWRTVFLNRRVGAPEHLLLHELAHVHQFARVRGFPVRYCLESLRRGYRQNRFEREADAYADRLVTERAARPGPTARAAAAAGPSP